MARLDGKVALVTGGASGIGKATSELFAAEGARVCVVDISEAGSEVAHAVGGRFVLGDVGDPDFNQQAVAACDDEFGGLDIAYLNAGVTTNQPDVAALTDEQYRRIMGVNVDGVVFGTRAAVPALERRGGGCIVATSSLAGILAFPLDPIYTLTKHAVVGFVRSLAAPLQEHGIRINCVNPGIVETPLLGEGAEEIKAAGFPLLQPGDIADAVLGIVLGDGTGECWCCQPGRPPEPYRFGGVPGPRTPGAQGMRPPGLAC